MQSFKPQVRSSLFKEEYPRSSTVSGLPEGYWRGLLRTIVQNAELAVLLTVSDGVYLFPTDCTPHVNHYRHTFVGVPTSTMSYCMPNTRVHSDLPPLP